MDPLPSGTKLIQSPSRIQTIQTGSPIRLQSLPPGQAFFTSQVPTTTIIAQPQQPVQNIQYIQQQPSVVSSKVDYPSQVVEAEPVKPKGLKPLECLICLIPIVLALIVLICSAWLLAHMRTTQNLDQAQGVISFVDQNQKAYPIKAIVQIEEGKQCPDGFTQARLGYWEGVYDGCLCENDKEKHRSAACLIKSKCESVKEVGKKEIFSWIANTDSSSMAATMPRNICVQRSVSFTKLNEQNFCPENFMKCGTFGCVHKDEKTCPLNFLKVIPSNAPATELNTFIIQKNTYQLVFSDSSDQPFISFEVSAGQAPCFDEVIEPEFQSHKFYPYARQPEQGCDKQFGQATPYFSLLGTMTEFTVFQINKIEQYVKALPFYKTYFDEENDKLNLLIQRRIASSSSKQCANLNVQGVDHIEEYASHFQGVEKGFAIFLIILCSIMILIGLVFAVLFFVKGLSKNPVKSLYILFILLVIFCVIILIVYAYKVKTLDKASDVYQTYLDKKCFGDAAPINDAFKSVTSHSDAVGKEFKNYSYLIFWFAIAFLILAIIAIFLKRRQNIESKQQDQQIFEKPWW